MSALTVPSGYRSDVFVRIVNAVPDLPGLAQCWVGASTASYHLVRVWKKGMWPGSSIAEPFNTFYNQLQPGDLLAVPSSWGDPPTSAACWQTYGPAGYVVGSVVLAPGWDQYSFVPVFTKATVPYAGGTINPIVKGAGQQLFQDPITQALVPLATQWNPATLGVVQAAYQAVGTADGLAVLDELVKGTAGTGKTAQVVKDGADCVPALVKLQKAGLLKAAAANAASGGDGICALAATGSQALGKPNNAWMQPFFVTGIGAGVGALVGHAFKHTAIGALVGAAAGFGVFQAGKS